MSNLGGFTGYAKGVATVASANPLSGNFAAHQDNFFVDAGGSSCHLHRIEIM